MGVCRLSCCFEPTLQLQSLLTATCEVDMLQNGLSSSPSLTRTLCIDSAALPTQRWSRLPAPGFRLTLGLALANRMAWK